MIKILVKRYCMEYLKGLELLELYSDSAFEKFYSELKSSCQNAYKLGLQAADYIIQTASPNTAN